MGDSTAGTSTSRSAPTSRSYPLPAEAAVEERLDRGLAVLGEEARAGAAEVRVADQGFAGGGSQASPVQRNQPSRS